jgi:hypothetical protein
LGELGLFFQADREGAHLIGCESKVEG